MRIPITFLIVFTLILISGASISAQTNNPLKTSFVEYRNRIDDQVGRLTQDDLKKIDDAIREQEKNTGLKAYVLIMKYIPGWVNDERFPQKQFAYWKSKGIVDDKSFLFIMSVEQVKFQVVRGSFIQNHENDYEVFMLRNQMESAFHRKAYGEGIVDYIKGLSEIPSLKKALTAEKKRHDQLLLFMLVIFPSITLIFILIRMRAKIKADRNLKKEKKEGPYIE